MLESAGAACVVEQSSEPAATASQLAERIIPLLRNTAVREGMGQAMRLLAKPNAAREVVDQLLQLVKSNAEGSLKPLEEADFTQGAA